MPGRSRKTKPRGTKPSPSRARRLGDLPFLAGIAVPLLTASLLVNLPAVRGQEWPRCVLHVLIWLATVASLLSATGFPFLPARRKRTILIALGIVALFAVASHYRFGQFRHGGSFVHHHEFYHYYMGSKYFPELGYDGLYAATHRALLDNDSAMAGPISVVKNLQTYRLESAAISLQRADRVQGLFSDARWREFKRDVAFFQGRIPPREWQSLLVDHGYNATPFWNLVGSLFSARLPLSGGTLGLLAALDVVLIGGMLVAVGWAFGPKTALLFTIFFFANFFATFDFTGGGFLRQLWLASLVGCVCFFHKRWMIPAGICLAVAVLDRAFPAVFLLLPAVWSVRESWRLRSLRHSYTRVLAAFALAVVLLGGLTLVRTGGATSWTNWYNNIRAHNQSFFINQIALRNLFIVNPATTGAVAAWDEAQWQREREDLDAHTRNTLRALRIVLCVLLVVLLAREKDHGVGLALLSFTPFLLFYPANYYCAFLVIAILFWRSYSGLALAVLLLQVPFWLLSGVLVSLTQLELLHWIVALCLSVTFVAFLALALIRNTRDAPGFRKLCVGTLAGGTLLLGGSVAADVSTVRRDPGRMTLDLTPRDVRSVRGATVQTELMFGWGSGWSRNDQLVCKSLQPGAQITVAVRAMNEGRYTLRVVYTKAPAFGIVEPELNGQFLGPPVNLFAPRLGVYTAVYEDVSLRGGVNDLTFTVVGKDPAATHDYFAIDTVSIAPEDDARSAVDERRRTLDRAIAWMRTHPANCFDGGIGGVCEEIVVLHQLASTSALKESHAVYESEIRERIDRLNANPAYRATPEEYESLAAAAWVAQQHRAELVVFKRAKDDVRQAATEVVADGSGLRALSLCSDLNRMDPAGTVPCRIEDSILHREHTERRLAALLAGEVNYGAVPVAMRSLRAIAADACALTDYAGVPAPSSPTLSDQTFWVRVCEDGLRWAMATGDVVTVARLILAAKALGVESSVSALPAAVDFLLMHQQSDGSFGVVDVRAPNPYREAVLATILALASSL